MHIDIQYIPQDQQRYDTIGDWYFCPSSGPCPISSGESRLHGQDVLHIRITPQANPAHNLPLAIHELIEALICNAFGISGDAVDAWDIMYEQEREILTHLSGPDTHDCAQLPCGCTLTLTSEPGDDPHAPYHDAHKSAMAIETVLVLALELDLREYVDAVEEGDES